MIGRKSRLSTGPIDTYPAIEFGASVAPGWPLGCTAVCHAGLGIARQQPFLDRLDLQRQVFRVDPALREAAGDEPEAGLRCPCVHVAQFLAVAESPDRADAARNLGAAQFAP